MNNYKLVLVLNSTLPEASRKKLLDTVKSWLKGAKFTKEDELGQKNLSYQIKKQTEGMYHSILFELSTIEKDFEKKIATTDGILRHLLVKVQN